jgi:hypothetical protein
MRSDDHELIVVLTSLEFSLKPIPACLVKKAMAMDIDRAIVFPLGIIEYDHLEWYIRLRQEAVTGKSGWLAGVDQVETVTDRKGGRFEKFLDPFRSQE